MTTPAQRCDELLPGVSRTFALLIPELPESLRTPVCCAYLLCRIADTVEDAADVPLETRLAAFDRLTDAYRTGDRRGLSALPGLAAGWPLDAHHRSLMDETTTVFAAFDALAAHEQAAIADCVLEMIEGMRETVIAGAASKAMLHEVADLERYCYYVAGVVGRMLTRLFWRHVHGEAAEPPADLVRQGIDFGLGLQLTNVLKDHRADLARGVSFMPDALASALNVGADSMLDGPLPAPIRQWLVARTARWLDTAFAYATIWPPEATGIRVFCLGALFMAVRTLVVVLTSEGRLDATENPKITRQDVVEIMARSRRDAADDDALRAWYAEEQRRLASRLK
jgi:farnesyl-diphosphate farnesyltransferase